MMTAFKGNLLDSDCDYICHQVNCQGRMGSGIAKAIRDKWPVVYTEYINKYKETQDKVLRDCGSFEFMPDVSEVLLGQIQLIDVSEKQSVINMFAQQFYGYDGQRYTSYDAFDTCIQSIKEHIPKGSSIGFPYKIGCGLGGANWRVIHAMIEDALDEDYDVRIYKLEE